MNLYEVDNISTLHFVVLALMVYRLTRFIIADTLFEPVRDWIFSKKPPHSSTLGYLFTPQVAGKLKTTKRDDAGNGFIWEGPNSGALVNGYRAMANNLLPKNLTKGAYNSVLHGGVFGNWSELIIAQWGGVDLLINPYTKGKEATVEIIINAWFDHGVRHVESFCKCDELYPSYW